MSHCALSAEAALLLLLLHNGSRTARHILALDMSLCVLPSAESTGNALLDEDAVLDYGCLLWNVTSIHSKELILHDQL